MYELFVRTEFSAAHRLIDYPGNCARWHGHNWTVCVYIAAATLNEVGLAVDFREVKDELRNLVGDLDHTNLNEFSGFSGANPSCEVIAKYLFDRLSERLNGETVRVSRVQVSESPNTGVSYSG